MNDTLQHATTWIAYPRKLKGRLSSRERDALPSTAFAFPHARKEPMTDAAHVRDALARFDQVEGVTDADRDLAFANIQRGANHFGIELKEAGWREFVTKHPSRA